VNELENLNCTFDSYS